MAPYCWSHCGGSAAPDTVRTERHLAEERRLRAAAGALRVVRNTVIHRVKRAEELLPRPPPLRAAHGSCASPWRSPAPCSADDTSGPAHPGPRGPQPKAPTLGTFTASSTPPSPRVPHPCPSGWSVTVIHGRHEKLG
ncbi:helix-turn-helix domain-containing protein [Streptomyces lydicus]|uniref:helix-turn-helix domain-containing protein n=1 Tax=Streptomyces lydicus TaxID=47763 RepID=UPI000D1B4818|nr:helix-turn-helix domain-containing protein [Streptomyces lydicus]